MGRKKKIPTDGEPKTMNELTKDFYDFIVNKTPAGTNKYEPSDHDKDSKEDFDDLLNAAVKKKSEDS